MDETPEMTEKPALEAETTETQPLAEAAEIPVPAADAEVPPAPEQEEAPPAPPVLETTLQPAEDAAEKGNYWSRVMTGDAATVPQDVRSRAGADDASLPPEEREYHLLSTINRSWLVDHSDMSREEVQGAWPGLRRLLSNELGAGNDEVELFSALSQRLQDAPKRERARKLYTDAYEQALMGKEPPSAEQEADAPICRLGAQRGARERAALLPAADRVARSLKAFDTLEGGTALDMLHLYAQVPELASVTDELAELDEGQKAALFRVALSRLPEGRRGEGPQGVLPAMWASAHRGAADLNLGLVQSLGHLGTAMVGNLGKKLDSPSLQKTAEGMDKRMQALYELQRVAQDRAYPIALAPDAGLAEQLAVDAAGALPGAGLAYCGGAGFGLLAASGMGDTIAEARARAPQGDHELQTLAGAVGAAVQAGIYAGMSRLGGQMLSRSLSSFGAAHGAGAYSLAALKTGAAVAGQGGSLLAADHASQAANLSLQEVAAQLDGTASNIDWRAFGKDAVSVEGNMREAARMLPFVLIGSGRVALRHFRDERAVLGERGEALAEWGVSEADRQRLMSEPDVTARGDMLRQMLTSSKRWSGLGFVAEAARALRLLHTKDYKPFQDEAAVRDFLRLPAVSPKPPKAEKADVTNPEVVEDMKERLVGDQLPAEVVPRSLPYLQLADTWWQRAFPDGLVSNMTDEYQLTSPKLGMVGYSGPENDALRNRELGDTVSYLDQLSYRFLLNALSVETLYFQGKSPAQTKKDTEDLRREFIGKMAGAVLLRHAGATKKEAQEYFGDFVSRYNSTNALRMGYHAWQREAGAPLLSRMHVSAFNSTPAGSGKNGVSESYDILRGMSATVMALEEQLAHHPDYQTSLSLGMSPQEAMTHLLARELGSRLPQDSWLPQQMEADATDRTQYAADNAAMMQQYTRLLGVEPESREGDDGLTYWRVLGPDGRYTHWHDSREKAVNDAAANARLRFLPHRQSINASLKSAYGPDGFDANLFTKGREGEFSHFDRVSAQATSDLMQLWQEHPLMMVPGFRPAHVLGHLGSLDRGVNPILTDDPDRPGQYLADELTLRTPYSLMKARFKTYWLTALTSGRLTPQETADFLVRRGMLSEKESRRILEQGELRRMPIPRKGKLPMEVFRERRREWAANPFRAFPELRDRDLAEALTSYTTGYALNHLRDLPLPSSVNEWFGLSAFLRPPTFSGKGANRKENADYYGRKDTTQSMRYAHRNAVADIRELMPLAEQIRLDEQQGGTLTEDPFYPQVVEALFPGENTCLEQGWGFRLGGGETFANRDAKLWNMLRDPAVAWTHLSPDQQAALRQAMPSLGGGEEDAVPPALVSLSAALKEHPELHGYDWADTADAAPEQLLPQVPSAEPEPAEDAYSEELSYGGRGYMQPDFELKQGATLPESWTEEGGQLGALRELSRLRRAVQTLPYAESNGIRWQGRLYNPETAELLPSMAADDGFEWKATRALPTLRRLFASLPEQGEAGLGLAGLPFAALPPLPEHAMGNITVYRSPVNRMAQMRLMPGRYTSPGEGLCTPYVVHTFLGAPMHNGTLAHNREEGRMFYQPLSEFSGSDVQYTGHMPDFRGREAMENALEMLRERTADLETLRASDFADVPNEELLMQLAEDTRFDRSMASRAPHEYNDAEAQAALLFYTLARYVYGSAEDRAQTAQQLVDMHAYFEQHPERRQALHDMLDDCRHWKGEGLKPWHHASTQLFGRRENIDHGWLADPKKPWQPQKKKAPRTDDEH